MIEMMELDKIIEMGAIKCGVRLGLILLTFW